MSYRQGDVLGRVERRRRFRLEQKFVVVAEASASGVVISAVGRRHGLLPAQVFNWRRLPALGMIGIPGASELPSFVAVEVAGDGAAETEPEECVSVASDRFDRSVRIFVRGP
jgi:transposase